MTRRGRSADPLLVARRLKRRVTVFRGLDGEVVMRVTASFPKMAISVPLSGEEALAVARELRDASIEELPDEPPPSLITRSQPS